MADFVTFTEDNRCTLALPLNPIVNTVRYTQIISLVWHWPFGLSDDLRDRDGVRLRAMLGIPDAIPLVLPKRLTMPTSVPLEMLDMPFFDWIQPEMGYYPGKVHTPSSLDSRHTVEVDPIAARKRGSIELEDQDVAIYLPDSDWDRLETEGEITLRLDEVDSPIVVRAKLPEIKVHNTVAFLATRRVMVNGSAISLEMDRSSVDSLVNRGVALAHNDSGELVRVTAQQVPQNMMLTMLDTHRGNSQSNRNLTDLLLEMQKYFGKANRIVFVNSFEQRWRLLGYSRGQLVSTFSLAPDEQVTLELFTFDHSTTKRTDDLTTELTRTTELNTNVTTTLDVVHETALTLQANAGVNGGVGLPAGELPVDINGGANANVGGEFQANLNETIKTVSVITLNIANNFRTTRQVKVVQTRESGREERITRVVRNPNGSRTLILDNFEVLENFEVTTQLFSHSDPALLVDCPELTFDEDFILSHKGFLRRNLIDVDYLPGINAVDIVVANEIALDILTTAAEDENEDVDNNGNNTGEQIDSALKRYAKRLQEIVQELSTADHVAFSNVYLELRNPEMPITGFQAPSEAAKREFQKWLAWQSIVVLNPTLHDGLLRYLDEVTVGRIPNGTTPGPLTNDVQKLVRELEAVSDGAESISAFLVFHRLLSNPTLLWDILGDIPPRKKAAIIAEMLSYRIIPNALSLGTTIQNIDRQLTAFQAANPFEVSSVVIGQDVDVDELYGGANVPIELLYGLREFADAKAQVQALMSHLEEYDAYYQNRFWFEETPNARHERFQATRGDLLSFIENRIVGFVGKQAVFPLRLGVDESIDDFVKNMRFYIEQSRKENGDIVDVREISLPTNNVSMESRLGQCEAFEPYLVERREIKKQLAQAQASLALERLRQQQLENERLQLRLDNGILSNPFAEDEEIDLAEEIDSEEPNGDDFIDSGDE